MLNKKQLKEAILSFLKKTKNPFDLATLVRKILEYHNANNDVLNFLKNQNTRIDHINIRKAFNLNIINENQLDEVVWDLINAKIITKQFIHEQRNSPTNDQFIVTDLGKKIINCNNLELSPCHKDNYIKKLESDTVKLDGDLLFYINQSIDCFNMNLFIPSSIMLGVSSEKIIQILIDLINSKLSDKTKTKFNKIRKEHRFTVNGDVEALKYIIEKIKNRLDDDIKTNFTREFECYWNIIRLARNDAGHPTEVKIGYENAFGNYIIFHKFCIKAHQLKRWIDKQEDI